MSGPDWQVYMIACTDGALYTGVTRDVNKRFAEHRSGKGAKFFRSRKADKVVYLEGPMNKSDALRREAAIKKLPKKGKEQLIAGEYYL